MKMKWTVEPCGGLYETWIITDGVRNFETYDYGHAIWLCDHLNKTAPK